MIKKYRKKLITVEAVQFNGENFDEVISFVGEDAHRMGDRFVIDTIKGTLEIAKNDYIVKEVNGACYSYKPDFFALAHERINSLADILGDFEMMLTVLPKLSKDLGVTTSDEEYIPTLYFCKGKWHIAWLHLGDDKPLINFEDVSLKGALVAAYKFCVQERLIRNIF